MPHPTDIVDHVTVVHVSTDRCDAEARNPAQAFVYAEFPDGRSLSYCAHHGTRYMDSLIAAGATIVDMRHTVAS